MLSAILGDAYLLCVIGLMSAIDRIGSLALKEYATRAAAQAAFFLSRTKRRRSEAGLAAAFGSRLSPVQRRSLARESFLTFWQEAFACIPLQAEHRRPAEVRVTGLEEIGAARQRGRGAILVESSFFGHRTLAKRALRARGIAVHQVHTVNHLHGFLAGRPTRARRSIGVFFEQRERAWAAEIVWLPAGDTLSYTRRLLGILSDNGVVCVSGDGVSGHKLIELPFLGETRPFTTGLVSLARLSGAPLLPMFCARAMAGVFDLAIGPALELSEAGGRERILADTMGEFARRLEAAVLQYPGQYRNWHSLSARRIPGAIARAR